MLLFLFFLFLFIFLSILKKNTVIIITRIILFYVTFSVIMNIFLSSYFNYSCSRMFPEFSGMFSVCIGNSMICSDIWHKYHKWYFKIVVGISRAIRRVEFETSLKYHKWYLCQISCTNHAIIGLYYYPEICTFHM